MKNLFTLPALLLPVTLLLGACTQKVDHASAVEAWRSDRFDRLQQPDGWLSLVGLHWIEPGEHMIGSGPDNDIVITTGPERLGQIRLQNGQLQFAPAADVATSIDQLPLPGEVRLDTTTKPPPRVEFAGGTASFEPLARGDRVALRVRDANAPTRLGFTTIEAYPVDASWRFDARFEANPPGSTLEIANVLGSVDPLLNPGALVFERDGREYRLQTVDEGGEQLFVIFADRTNRKQTYGAGRFVYVDRPVGGMTELDFNRAYNPPCAFTAYSTCPLPPPENRLDVEVTAGELRYTGPTS